MSLNLEKSKWKRVAFGDVVDNVNDILRDAAAAGIDRIVAMEHLDPGKLKIQRWGSTEDGTTFTRRVKPRQTLFGKRRAYQRKVAYAEFDAVCSGDIYTFEADETQLRGDYLPFLVQSNEFFDYALDTSAGSLSPRTSWRDLTNFQLNLPPLEDQKRIADLLWAVEGHGQAIRGEVAEAQRCADETFRSALSQSSAVAVPLPQLVEEMTVGIVVRPTQYYTDDSSGVPALRGLNIKPGGFDLSELVRFRPESAAQLAKSTLRLGDVVIVRTGRPGDAAVVNDETVGFNCIDMIITRPGADLEPEFLALLLNSSFGREQIARLSAGTAQQHFNVGALKKLKLPSLRLVDQKRIIALVESIRASGSAAQQELEAVVALQAALMNDVFGGS